MDHALSDANVIDLSVFHDIRKPNEDCTNFISCPCILRLLTALQYYSLIKLRESKDNHDILTNFINQIYKLVTVIDDFIHLQQNHGEQIYEIMNYALNKVGFIKCSIQTCEFTDRHYQMIDDHSHLNNSNNQDPNMNVYCDTMDLVALLMVKEVRN